VTSELQRAQESIANLRDAARQHHLSRAKISSKLLKYPNIDDYAVRVSVSLSTISPFIFECRRLLFESTMRDSSTMRDAHCMTSEPCTPCSQISSTRTLQRYFHRVLDSIPATNECSLLSRFGFPRVTMLHRCIEYSNIQTTAVNPPPHISSTDLTYRGLPIFGKGNFSIAVL